jgi:hypothetical protein
LLGYEKGGIVNVDELVTLVAARAIPVRAEHQSTVASARVDVVTTSSTGNGA